jgi:hypothetical protein
MVILCSFGCVVNIGQHRTFSFFFSLLFRPQIQRRKRHEKNADNGAEKRAESRSRLGSRSNKRVYIELHIVRQWVYPAYNHSHRRRVFIIYSLPLRVALMTVDDSEPLAFDWPLPFLVDTRALVALQRRISIYRVV